MAGFSDNPIILPSDAKTYHDLFEAKHVTKYLEDYVDNHVYNGSTLRSRITFDFKVVETKRDGESWKICGHHKSTEASETMDCAKLIVASGSTSTPFIPSLPYRERFGSPIIHQKAFGKASTTILTSSSYQNVTVLGGGKSAADMVYDLVKAGKKNVSWIIRESGAGPAALSGASGKGPYKNRSEMAATRILSALSPSAFAPLTWWAKTMHSSTIGRSLIAKIWHNADLECRGFANFEGREGARSDFRKLEPSTTKVLPPLCGNVLTELAVYFGAAARLAWFHKRIFGTLSRGTSPSIEVTSVPCKTILLNCMMDQK